MRARWILLASLVLVVLTLGWARAVRQRFAPAEASPSQSQAESPSATAAQTLPDDQPPEIRSSEVIFDFTQQAQLESAQDANQSPQGQGIAEGKETATLISSPVAVTLVAPAPFLALSAIWTARSAIDAKLTVSVRASNDGDVWGDWQLSSLDGDPRTHSGLFFLPQETKFIQYRVEMARDPRQVSPQISLIRLRFISPGATPPWMHERMRSQPAFEGSNVSGNHRLAAAGGTFPKPSFVSRLAWGCPDGDQQHRGAPSYMTVTHLIVHHTATGNEASDWPAVMRSIWNFHVFTNGWSDLGYNYLVDPNGMIYEGRAGGDNVLGAHFSCANSGTMGTAMLGTYTDVVPTEQALTRLKYLLAWKSDQRGIDPSGVSYHGGTQLNLQNISGHRDANASTAPNACPGTECPGNSLYPRLPGIRNEVKMLADPSNDFSLAANPPVGSVQVGSSANFTITTATVKGTAQSLKLEASGLPSGITAVINPPTVTSGNAASLQLSIASNVASGIYPLTITASGSTIRAQQINLSVTGTIATVSAASYKGERIAREAIVSAFGAGLAASLQTATTLPLPTTLGGITLKVRDSLGSERNAPLFFISPNQINYQIPPGTANGPATVTVINNNSTVAVGTMLIADVAPALFSANSSGNGIAAASALRVKADGSQSYEPVAEFDPAQSRFIARPLDLGAPTDQVFLLLFGTGIRYRTSQDQVRIRVGGIDAQVFYAGEQGGFVGLDQINVLLPQSLRGKGEVDLELMVDGQAANVVRVSIQ